MEVNRIWFVKRFLPDLEDRGKHQVGICPSCGGKHKLYVNKTTLLWDCKKCGKKGNYKALLEQCLTVAQSNIADADFAQLASNRQLPAKAFLGHGIGCVGNVFVVPTWDIDHKLVDLRWWKPGAKLKSAPGASVGLFGAHRCDDCGVEVDVYLTEGEWDAIALRWVFRKAGVKVLVVAVPGAGTFKDEWRRHFRGRNVFLAYDNDDPGAKGESKAAQKLAGIAKSLHFFDWTVHEGEGKDLRDIITAALKGVSAGDRDAYQRLAEGLLASFVDAPRIAPAEKDELLDTGRKSQATRVVELADAAELFHDSGGRAFARIAVSGQHRCWPINSRGFKNWLRQEFWRECRGALGGQVITDVVAQLESRAVQEGACLPVGVRLADLNGEIFLDLADDQWRAVRVTAAGWEIRENPEARFVRPRGLLALPTPVLGGGISDLRKFLNIDSKRDWALTLGWMVAAFRPQGPYPLLVVNGEQGAAKSTFCRVLRALVDPNTSMLRAEPRDERDLMIAARNSWILAFDNMSRVSPWLSDALCRLATGGGFATRQLFSDDDEIIFEAKRPIIINGIEDLASRSDLLDRSICLTLPQIPDSHRRQEAEFWNEFEAAKPKLLGALLTAVASAMKNHPTTHLAHLPRMADFASWAVAAEPALGLRPGQFLEAYSENRAAQDDLVLDTSAIGQAIQALAKKHCRWEGTAAELLHRITAMPASDGLRPDWPRTPRKLAGELRRLAPNLRREGINVDFPGKTGKDRRRLITIERSRPQSPASPAARQK